MKTFVYGRPAVEGGDRGYRIFKHQGLENEEVKALKDLFSDEDPDVRRLQKDHFLPFFVWFPWRNGDWVFGKGRVEARGRLGAMYYSYLFHGCVLDQERRALLGHNPFVLSDFFDPSEERRGNPPLIPEKINEKGLLLNLCQKARHLVERDPLRDLAGQLVQAYLLGDGARALFTHDGRFDGHFWGVAYALLPPSLRARTSLTTWQPFLPAQTSLAGLAEEPGEGSPPDVLVVRLHQKQRTVFGDFITRLALDEHTLKTQLRCYEAVCEDLLGVSVESRAGFLENLFRAIERPSVQSLELWPPVGVSGFAHKVAHFERVWRQNGGEQKHFPGLADRVLAGLHQDFQRLPDARRGENLALWSGLFQQVAPYISERALRLVLADPLLCAHLADNMDPARVVLALADPSSGDELNRTMAVLSKHHPRAQAIFIALVKRVWGHYLRACKAAQKQAIDAYGQMLDGLAEHDGEGFGQHSRALIFSRWLDHGLPYLSARPFVLAGLNAWYGAVSGEDQTHQMARLRLVACLKALYGAVADWPDRWKKMGSLLSANWLMTYYYEGMPGGRP